MKGITPIIATIVLLLITMGLLAMAYTFMTGLFNVKKSFVFPTDAVTCVSSGPQKGLYLYIFNNGQEPLSGTIASNSFDILEVDGVKPTNFGNTSAGVAITLIAGTSTGIPAMKTDKLFSNYTCELPGGCANGNHRIRLGIGTNVQEITEVC